MNINGVEYCDPYKNKKNDKIYWLDPLETRRGEYFFSFDLKKVYNLFEDYPWNLTKDEKEIFDKENPHWKEFFAWRS